MKKSLYIIGGFALAAIICIISVKLWGPNNPVEQAIEAELGAVVIV